MHLPYKKKHPEYYDKNSPLEQTSGVTEFVLDQSNVQTENFIK